MEASKLVCDGDLLTGSCVFLAFAASNFELSQLYNYIRLFTFHHKI